MLHRASELAGCCEYGNEPSGSIKGEVSERANFHEVDTYLKSYKFLKRKNSPSTSLKLFGVIPKPEWV
jgi:hypothetical protein